MEKGQWMYHTIRHQACVFESVVESNYETHDGQIVDIVKVRFSEFGMMGVPNMGCEESETFASSLVPIEQAPFYITELLEEWRDALVENCQRAQQASAAFANQYFGSVIN